MIISVEVIEGVWLATDVKEVWLAAIELTEIWLIISAVVTEGDWLDVIATAVLEGVWLLGMVVLELKPIGMLVERRAWLVIVLEGVRTSMLSSL